MSEQIGDERGSILNGELALQQNARQHTTETEKNGCKNSPCISATAGFYIKHCKLSVLSSRQCRREDTGALFLGQCDSTPVRTLQTLTLGCRGLHSATDAYTRPQRVQHLFLSRCCRGQTSRSSDRALGSFQLGGRSEKQQKCSPTDGPLRKSVLLLRETARDRGQEWEDTEHIKTEDTTDNRTLRRKVENSGLCELTLSDSTLKSCPRNRPRERAGQVRVAGSSCLQERSGVTVLLNFPSRPRVSAQGGKATAR